MDKVTLFEQSLHILGDREYKRESPTGRECDLWFPIVLAEALNFGSWSFATLRRILPPVSPGVYRLPEDCLRPLKINHSSFELIGRDILLHTTYQPEPDNGLELTYITNALGKAEILPDSQPLWNPSSASASPVPASRKSRKPTPPCSTPPTTAPRGCPTPSAALPE